jgi:hypothetical protein
MFWPAGVLFPIASSTLFAQRTLSAKPPVKPVTTDYYGTKVAQNPPQFATSAEIHALGAKGLVRKLRGEIPAYISPSVSHADASEVQSLMTGCVAMYRRALPHLGLPHIELAILDRSAWEQVSSSPYGVPQNSGVAPVVVVLVPQDLPQAIAATSTAPPGQRVRFFHLLALHELGHILMYRIIGVNTPSSWNPRHFPQWYLEFAANYIGLTCLSKHPADQKLFRGSEAAFKAIPRPTLTRLDDFRLLFSPDRPGAMTPDAMANFARYQHLITLAACRAEIHLGLRFIPLMRHEWNQKGNVTTAEIVRDYNRAVPGFAAWLRSYGAIK